MSKITIDECLNATTYDNIQYYHVSDKNKTLHTLNGWGVKIGSGSTIGFTDGNIKAERVGVNLLKIYPTPTIRVPNGTLYVTDHCNSDCFEERKVYVMQENGLWVDVPSNIILVSKDCCDENNNPKNVLKIGAFKVSWGAWIKCIKVECYEPYVKAFRDGSNINLCVNTCYDLYNVQIFIIGYDKCGNIIANQTVTVDIIHSDVKNDCTDEESNKYAPCSVCDSIDENLCNGNCEDEDDSIFPDLTEDPTLEPTPDETPEIESECKLMVTPTFFTIPYVKNRTENFDAVMKFVSYSNNENAILKFGKDVLIDNATKKPINAYGFLNGIYTYSLTPETLEKFGTNGSGYTVDFCISPGSGCCVPVRFEVEEYVETEPRLDVYYMDIVEPSLADKGGIEPSLTNNVIPNNSILFFCDRDEDGFKTNTSCFGALKLYYDGTHEFEVKAGTASWYIYSYDSSIISCRKYTKKENGESKQVLLIKLIQKEAIPCKNKQQIILKNNANQYFSIYFAVDTGLVKEDIFNFDWDVVRGSLASYSDRYYDDTKNEVSAITCLNYYENNTATDPFIFHSEYALAIDNNNTYHTGGWSYMSKGATYQIERCTTTIVDGKLTNIWSSPINSYQVDDETYLIRDGNLSGNTVYYVPYENKPYYKEYFVGKNEDGSYGNYLSNVSGGEISKDASGNTIFSSTTTSYTKWGDTVFGKFKVFIGNVDASKAEVGDIRITTRNTFTQSTLITKGAEKTSKCYIDFVQAISNITIRLYIVHPAVVVYNIYTDQKGEINVDTK